MDWLDKITYSNKTVMAKPGFNTVVNEKQGGSIWALNPTSIKSSLIEKQEKSVKSDVDVNLNDVIKEWREDTKTRPSGKEYFKSLKAQGYAKAEIGQQFRVKELEYIKEDTNFLIKKFEEDPSLRVKMQENFEKLSPSEQKALLNEFYLSKRNGENGEIERLVKGLESARSDVKSLTIAVLRKDKRANSEAVKRLQERLHVEEAQVIDRLPKIGEEEAISTVANIMGDEKSTNRAKLAATIPNLNKEVVPFAIKTFTSAKSIKNDFEAKKAFIKSISKYDAENQIYASKMAIDSDYFNSEDRDSIIKEIKNFESKEVQQQVAKYVNESDKIDVQNRVTFAKEIKNLNKEVQESVVKDFKANEKNSTDEKIIKTLSDEAPKMNITEETKNSIKEAVAKYLDEKTEVEAKTQEFQEEARTNIKSQDSKIQEVQETQNSQNIQNDDNLQLDVNLYQSQNIDKNNFIKVSELNTAIKKEPLKPSTILQFSDMLDKGEIKPSSVIAAGYTNVLVGNFSILSKDMQEVVFDMLDNEKLLEMYSQNKIPKRFEDKVMARFAQGNIDSITATRLSNTVSCNELVGLYANAKSNKNQTIFKENLQKRFTEKYEKMIEEGKLA